jgi:hypothetical protein
MEHGTVRKLTRAATLSLLLAMTSGVVGLDVMAASPAMAQPKDPGSGSAPGSGSPVPDVTGLVGGLTGGSGTGGSGTPTR